MVCGNCGCRMVAKSLSDALVCVDCGQPADVRALQDGARRSWTAAVALLGFAGFSALVLAFAVMLDLRQEQLSPTQALTGRLE